MVYILSQIPLKELKESNNILETIDKTQYFKMKANVPSKQIYESIKLDISWYNFFDKTNLFIIIMNDSYFYNTFKQNNLSKSIHLSRFVSVPKYVNDENHKVIPEKERTLNEENIESIIHKIKDTNFRKEKFVEICSNAI